MKRVEFRPPAGFAVPEGSTEAGQEFESMAKFRVKANGQLCLIAIGDHPMPGYGNKDYMRGMRDMREDGNEVVAKYHQAMG